MNCSLIDKIANILCAVGAIGVGLMFFNIDIFGLSFMTEHLHFLIKPLQILIGLAGCYSLVYLFTCAEDCSTKK